MQIRYFSDAISQLALVVGDKKKLNTFQVIFLKFLKKIIIHQIEISKKGRGFKNFCNISCNESFYFFLNKKKIKICYSKTTQKNSIVKHTLNGMHFDYKPIRPIKPIIGKVTHNKRELFSFSSAINHLWIK